MIRGKLDYVDSNFTARETQDSSPLQTIKQTLTTSKQFTYSDFPGHFKVNSD